MSPRSRTRTDPVVEIPCGHPRARRDDDLFHVEGHKGDGEGRLRSGLERDRREFAVAEAGSRDADPVGTAHPQPRLVEGAVLGRHRCPNRARRRMHDLDPSCWDRLAATVWTWPRRVLPRVPLAADAASAPCRPRERRLGGSWTVAWRRDPVEQAGDIGLHIADSRRDEFANARGSPRSSHVTRASKGAGPEHRRTVFAGCRTARDSARKPIGIWSARVSPPPSLCFAHPPSRTLRLDRHYVRLRRDLLMAIGTRHAHARQRDSTVSAIARGTPEWHAPRWVESAAASRSASTGVVSRSSVVCNGPRHPDRGIRDEGSDRISRD